MTFPHKCHTGTQARVARSIRRRAVALSALESGLNKDECAARVGITRNMLNRLLRSDWNPGATKPDAEPGIRGWGSDGAPF